ncbi:preprotein translocase subunit SecD [Quadrisphaera sp. INWT6]|uniref:preprotein translocase subunit SecD n=1 Tax=Quadrisphaera sp. INWT6 TaxID=2596917 RepID=UPI0019D5F85C|nr:hypothetical protein [Quadrisphaera sp. INWT6]
MTSSAPPPRACSASRAPATSSPSCSTAPSSRPRPSTARSPTATPRSAAPSPRRPRRTLANQLKFGALPISFTQQSVERISAVLGSEQLERGLLAGAIGLVLVVVYSMAQYRALGLVTVASLFLAAGISYLLTVLLGWGYGYRLSLAGVAGFIVSIGITADSFIVFFERVRDEVARAAR